MYIAVPCRPNPICLPFDELIYVVAIFFSFVFSSAETQLVLDKDNKNEKPSTSTLANLGSEAGKDHRKEDNSAASGRIMSAGTPVSNPKGESV